MRYVEIEVLTPDDTTNSVTVAESELASEIKKLVKSGCVITNIAAGKLKGGES